MKKIQINENGKEKIFYVEEKFLDSVGSDIVTFLITLLLLYITKNYLGNSWLTLLMMFITTMCVLQKSTYKKLSKEELIKMLQNEESKASVKVRSDENS